MKVIYGRVLLMIIVTTLVASTTSSATTVHASNDKSSSDSSSTGSGSKGSDTSGSSASDSTSGSGSSGSQSSGSGSTPPPSGPAGGQSSGTSGGASNPSSPPPSPPGQPSTPSNPNSGGCDHPLRAPCLPVYKPQTTKECPNGEVVDINAKCPIPVTAPPGHTKDFGQGFTQGAEDGKVGVYDAAAACAGASNTAHCIQGYDDSYVAACSHGKFGCGDGPTTCTPGEVCSIPQKCPDGTTSNAGKPCFIICHDMGTCGGICPPLPLFHSMPTKCVHPLPPNCHELNNFTIVCVVHRTEVHNTHTTTVRPVPTSTDDINLMLVTTCTADQNNGVLNGNLAALCDSTITMMHNDGLDAQLPQVDLYLKARGLLS